ncbi:MAG: hypothetical protein NDI94_04415 [Candidatus Woesearchaeota archaeon]|nr:hypothetical protein [Candidatus Woesearchaeota archaeon]
MNSQSLESLVIGGTYKARLAEPMFNLIDLPGDGECPVVEIFGPKDTINPSYIGYMVESSHPKFRYESNAIRKKLLEQANGGKEHFPNGFNVHVLSNEGNGTSSYFVVGTAKSADESKFEMPLSDAVFIGPNVFTARYLFTSSRERAIHGYGGYGYDMPRIMEENPAVRVWDEQERKQFGFLHQTRKPKNDFWSFDLDRTAEAKGFAGEIISYDLLNGNEEKEISPLKPGDYTLVRHVADTDSGPKIFEPVINFETKDHAVPRGGYESIVTSVDSYERGGLISNLPVLWLTHDNKRGGKIAIGYVARPEHEMVNFFYKPVLIQDAEHLVGSYVPKAEIIANGKIILARKV